MDASHGKCDRGVCCANSTGELWAFWFGPELKSLDIQLDTSINLKFRRGLWGWRHFVYRWYQIKETFWNQSEECQMLLKTQNRTET